MASPCRADGLAGGVCWVQLVPSHNQVWLVELPVKTLPMTPPNITAWLCAASKAIPANCIDGGLVCGDFCVQFVPSHTHVSLKIFPLVSEPPNRTTCPCAES